MKSSSCYPLIGISLLVGGIALMLGCSGSSANDDDQADSGAETGSDASEIPVTPLSIALFMFTRQTGTNPGTDFFAINVKTAELIDQLTIPNSTDSVMWVDNDRVLIHDGSSQTEESTSIHIMDSDQPLKIAATIDWKEYDLPNHIAIANPEKAYAVSRRSNDVSVIDLTTAKITREIDLSPFNVAGDGDDLVDPFGALYDARTRRTFIGLKRNNDEWDKTTIGEKPIVCRDVKSALIAIDIDTDTVVDLNGDAPGEAFELKGFAAVSMKWNANKTKLLITHAGCSTRFERDKHGVEVFDPSTSTSEWLWKATQPRLEPTDLVALSNSKIGISMLDYSISPVGRTVVFKFDMATKTLHSTPWELPFGIFLTSDRDNTMVGFDFPTSQDNIANVNRYNAETEETTVLAEDLGECFDADIFTYYAEFVK